MFALQREKKTAAKQKEKQPFTRQFASLLRVQVADNRNSQTGGGQGQKESKAQGREQTKQVWQLPPKEDRNAFTSKWDNKTLRNVEDKSSL